MAGADTPLTSLCAICHINPLKYTCPRCGIHTCSLPCVKLHKKRAQCSGIRNPAEYRKRSELATESSFDKDFNFIASVERNVQRADNDVTEKKIDLRPARVFDSKAISGLEKAADDRGVRLVRAPMGLSRRKENKSRVLGKSGILSWTVEWVDRNEKKRFQNHEETKTIAEAYFICHPKRGAGKKRKRGQEAPGPPTSTATTISTHQETALELPKFAGNGSFLEHANDVSQQEEQLMKSLEASRDARPINEVKADGVPSVDDSSGLDPERILSPDNALYIPDNIHFYLHRPQTTSKIKCLIPIDATDTIKDALKGKKIVEFPTIYARDEAPNELTEPFILESKYLEQHGEDVLIPPAPVLASDNISQADDSIAEAIDSQTVLEVLNKDLISV